MAVFEVGTEPGVMNVEKVADLLDVSTDTVYREIARGHLRCVRVGRQIRVTNAHLAEYLEGDR